MTQASFAPKPDSFVATFTPTGSTHDWPTGSLPFQTTIDTAEYRVTVSMAATSMLTTSADGQCVLVLAGDIYEPRAANVGQALLALYERLGLDFVNDLNGAFCLLLIDRRADVIALVTDRMNSIRLLVSWHGGTLIASNSIYLQPTRDQAIDRAAVAAYLAVNHAYNDRTLYEGIRLLDYGSIYRLSGGRLAATRYWHYRFEPTSAAPETLKKELGDVLVEAARRRLPADGPIYLSLSAGYDSTTVLGLLAHRLRVPDVRCFSYGYGDPLPNSDEYLAARLAERAGYSHQLVSAFDGKVARSMALNAALGGGMTRYCDEVDAWIRLGAQAATRPVLFTGDILLLKAEWELRDIDDVLASARMRDFRVLSWLEPFLGRASYTQMVEATQADIAAALKRAPADQQGEDLRDVLRFDHLHSRVTGTWREYFTSRFFRPAHPLLDNAFLDFSLRLPVPLRRGKVLFRDTVTAMFPDLFAVPRAQSAGYAHYWPDVLTQHRAEVEALIRAESSPLDDIIPPDVLLALLVADRPGLTRQNARLRSALKSAYSLLKRLNLQRTTLGRPSRFTPSVSADEFLKRALTLRAFLSAMGR